MMSKKTPVRLALAALVSAFAVASHGADTGFSCSDAAKARARDFIENERQFHLGFLPTERSNSVTSPMKRRRNACSTRTTWTVCGPGPEAPLHGPVRLQTL